VRTLEKIESFFNIPEYKIMGTKDEHNKLIKKYTPLVTKLKKKNKNEQDIIYFFRGILSSIGYRLQFHTKNGRKYYTVISKTRKSYKKFNKSNSKINTGEKIIKIQTDN